MMCIYNIIFKYCCLKRTKTKNKIKNVILKAEIITEEIMNDEENSPSLVSYSQIFIN